MVKKYIKRLNIGYEWLENNSESLMGKGPERVAAKPFPLVLSSQNAFMLMLIVSYNEICSRLSKKYDALT